VEEETKIVSSFKELLASDPIYYEMFLNLPALTYVIYGAACDLTKEGMMSVSMKEAMERVITTLRKSDPSLPTIEELQSDTDGSLHERLEVSIAPNLIAYLVNHLEETMKPKGKRGLH